MGKITNINYEKIVSLAKSVLLQNQDFCKLVYYTDTNDPLSMPDIEDTSILLESNEVHRKCIYSSPFYFDEEYNTKEDKMVFVSIFVHDAKPNNIGFSYFKDVRLGISVIAHRDIWDVASGSRVYKIIQEINREFLLKSNLDGLGRTLDGSVQPVHASNKYHGYVTYFRVTDFS